MTTNHDDQRGTPKSYTQLAKEFPDNKGYRMMADRERVMGHPAASEPRKNDRVGGKTFQQLAKENPNDRGLQMMAERERLFGDTGPAPSPPKD